MDLGKGMIHTIVLIIYCNRLFESRCIYRNSAETMMSGSLLKKYLSILRHDEARRPPVLSFSISVATVCRDNDYTLIQISVAFNFHFSSRNPMLSDIILIS
jgi:hypothetical protein